MSGQSKALTKISTHFDRRRGHARHVACSAITAATLLLSCATVSKPYSYVALHDQSSVGVFDHATNAWVGTIAVGAGPVGVGADAAQQTAFITNFRAGTVSVVRVANRTVVGTISVGAAPMGVAVSLAQPRAYVANFGSNTVSVIGTATNTVLSTVNVGAGPTAVTASASGDRIFVANTIDNTVSVIDAASNLVTQTIVVTSADNPQPKPYALAFVQGVSGSRLLVANNNAASVSVFDGTSYAPLAELKVGAHPSALARAQDNKVFVLDSFDGVLHTIDPFANTVTAGPLPATARARSLAASTDGSRASMTADQPARLSALNTSSNAVTPIGTVPGGLNASLTLGNFVINPSFECALDISADNAFNATDTTLIARYLIGIRGTALVAGLPGLNATTVAPLLAGLALDADNDGVARATTDGVLLRRAATGSVGGDLIANARNSAHPSVFNATQILNWIVTTHGADCLP